MYYAPQGKIHLMIKTNEVVLKVNNEWLHFAEPKQIMVAETLEDVLPAFREMERLVNVNAWYAAGFLSYEAASAFDPALRTKAVVQAEKDRKSTRLNSSHSQISYAVFCLKKKNSYTYHYI